MTYGAAGTEGTVYSANGKPMASKERSVCQVFRPLTSKSPFFVAVPLAPVVYARRSTCRNLSIRTEPLLSKIIAPWSTLHSVLVLRCTCTNPTDKYKYGLRSEHETNVRHIGRAVSKHRR